MPKWTQSEIDDLEQELGHKLPALYHRLLFEIGCGPIGDKAEIYYPLAIRDLYELFFDGPGQLCNPHFPFGCQNRKQEVWIIDAKEGKAAAL